MDDTQQLKDDLTRKRSKPKVTKGLSSGATMLNLACTGRTKWCYLPGHVYLFVGDSQAGKTWLGLSAFAEACRNPKFQDYRLIFDNAERGALMDIAEYFGQAVADRLEPPSTGADDKPVFSETVEELYYHLSDAYDDKRPFIYIMDSMDSLGSEQDEETFEKNKQAHRKGKEASGSYGMRKAYVNSQGLRKAMSELPKTGSILIIICQTRDTVQKFGFGDTKTRAGGRALKFYSTLEIWMSIKEPIKKSAKGKLRKIGVVSKVNVKKNRVTGRDRSVFIPIINSVGVDETGSMVDYLVEENHWKVTGSKIRAHDFDLNLGREELIQEIEEKELEQELRLLVGSVWQEIEDALIVRRKKRYD